MFKKILVGILVAVIVVAAGASAYAALAAPAAQNQEVNGTGNANAGDTAGAANAGNGHSDPLIDEATIPATLTAEETAGLLYMVEEEKLARDVYDALYALWGQSTFQSIAVSEQDIRPQQLLNPIHSEMLDTVEGGVPGAGVVLGVVCGSMFWIGLGIGWALWG